jgi:hypothetical protein
VSNPGTLPLHVKTWERGLVVLRTGEVITDSRAGAGKGLHTCMQIALRANEMQLRYRGRISFMAGIRCDWDGRNIRLRGGEEYGKEFQSKLTAS